MIVCHTVVSVKKWINPSLSFLLWHMNVLLRLQDYLNKYHSWNQYTYAHTPTNNSIGGVLLNIARSCNWQMKHKHSTFASCRTPSCWLWQAKSFCCFPMTLFLGKFAYNILSYHHWNIPWSLCEFIFMQLAITSRYCQ